MSKLPDHLADEVRVLGCLLHLPTSSIPAQAVFRFGQDEVRAAVAAVCELRAMGLSADDEAIVSRTGDERTRDVLAGARAKVPLSIREKDLAAALARVTASNLRRVVVHSSRSAYDAVHEPSASPEEVASKLIAEVQAGLASDGRGLTRGGDIREVIEAMQEEAARGGVDPGIPTGLPRLDKVTGGFRPEFWVVGARPSTGKSTFAYNSIISMMDEHRPLIVTAEVRADKLKRRILCSMAGLHPDDAISTKGNRAAILVAANKMHASHWNIYDSPSIDIDDLVAVTRDLHSKGECDCLFVDYIQKLRCRRVQAMKGTMFDQLQECSYQLAELTRDLRIPVVALAQLRRGETYAHRGSGEMRVARPTIEMLKSCGSFEEDADIVLLLHRSDDGSAVETELEVLVAKNRFGAKALLKFDFNGKTGRITDRRITV